MIGVNPYETPTDIGPRWGECARCSAMYRSKWADAWGYFITCVGVLGGVGVGTILVGLSAVSTKEICRRAGIYEETIILLGWAPVMMMFALGLIWMGMAGLWCWVRDSWRGYPRRWPWP